MKKENVTIGIATMQGREKALEEALLSLVNQDVNIYVYFNNFKCIVPSEIQKIIGDNKNITPFFSEIEQGDLTDFGGFYKVHELDGYFISCDDDLIYPPNFVKNITEACKRYENKAIVGYHGRIYQKFPAKTYYHGYSELLHISQDLKKDRNVHIVAGCAMCFHTSTFDINIKHIDYIEYPRMKDIHISIEAKRQGVKRIVLAHEKNYFQLSDKYDPKQSIHKQEHRADKKQTDLFNSETWEVINPIIKKRFRNEAEKDVLWRNKKSGKTFLAKPMNVKSLVRAGKIELADIKSPEIEYTFKKNID